MANHVITCPKSWCSFAGHTVKPLLHNAPNLSRLYSLIPNKFIDEFKKKIALSSSEHSIFKDESIFSENNHSNVPFAYLVSSDSTRSVDYYVFDNDDKYFYVHDHAWFHDTILYNSFYRKLPTLTDCALSSHEDNFDPAQTLVIFSRKQFGHFLFDDLLPCVASLDQLTSIVKNVILMYSEGWQCDATETIMHRFYPEINLVFRKLPSMSRQISFSGLTILPVYPEILFRFKNTCEQSNVEQRLEYLYLHRGGYGNANRVRNYREYISNFQKPISLLVPHKHKFEYVIDLIRGSRNIICEPGTLPLLAYFSRSEATRIDVMFSKRCLSECPLEYFYSGWRYHLPWLETVCPIWLRPELPNPNPFSDVGSIPLVLHGF
jgi:hypothetical protein